MLDTEYSSWPSFTDEEAEAVKSVILSNKVNYWTGSECRSFEKEFADWCGVNYAVAVANGTVALDLALKALDIGPGDEVVVTPRTFLASVSSVVTAGAKPIFAEVDRNSQNISADTIAKVVTPLTRAIIVVHLAGMPADMTPIMQLANSMGIHVIEDCAQAHGAKYRGQRVGSIGHIGAWSFCQDKIMTTGGEGGMVTTDSQMLWKKMWSYKDHGKNYAEVYADNPKPGFRWLHDSFGTNWRMTEVQAVIGRIQLKKMGSWTALRQRNASILLRALRPFAGQNKLLRIPEFRCGPRCEEIDRSCDGCHHAYYKLYVFVNVSVKKSEFSRDRIIDLLREEGVPCMQGSCSEVYLEKAFDETQFRPTERLPVARELGETSIMFMVHPSLKRWEIEQIAEKAASVCQKIMSYAPL